MPDRYAEPRKRMVERHLARRDIRDLRVLDAFGRVPREEFLRPEDRPQAYEDHPVGIGHGQTISQPYIVALMTQALELTGTEKVLEIGTGSGYQTAILCETAAEVYSIERIAELSEQADRVLKSLGYANYRLHVGDGTVGWPEVAPFDRIIVTAAGPEVPATLKGQLAEGGIMVIPVGPTKFQQLLLLRREGGGVTSRSITDVRFVRLIGEEAYRDEGYDDSA